MLLLQSLLLGSEFNSYTMIKEIKIWILFHRSGIPIYSIVDVVVVVVVERKHKNSATGSIFSVD